MSAAGQSYHNFNDVCLFRYKATTNSPTTIRFTSKSSRDRLQRLRDGMAHVA
jgi:hypothetical protein